MIEKSLYFYSPSEKMPKPFKACVICVDFGRDGEAVFYGMHDGDKWIGCMEDNPDQNSADAWEPIYGSVSYWAKFPVSFDF